MCSDVRYLAAISKWSSLQYDNSKECLANSSNNWNVGCLKISDRQETIILSLKSNNSRSSHSSNSFCLILYLPHISSMTNIWRLSDTFFYVDWWFAWSYSIPKSVLIMQSNVVNYCGLSHSRFSKNRYTIFCLKNLYYAINIFCFHKCFVFFLPKFDFVCKEIKRRYQI